MQPVRSCGQTGGPHDAAIAGVAVAIANLALGDNVSAGGDFPVQRQPDSRVELGPRRLTGSDHHRPGEKAVRQRQRQGIEDNFQRNGIRHMALTLTVDKFGLDSQVFSSGEKVHSARCLQAMAINHREIIELGEEDSRV